MHTVQFWPQFGCLNAKHYSYTSQLLVWHIRRQPNNEHCDQIWPLMIFCQCQMFWVLQSGFSYYNCQIKKSLRAENLMMQLVRHQQTTTCSKHIVFIFVPFFVSFIKMNVWEMNDIFACYSTYECSSQSPNMSRIDEVKLQTESSCVCPFLTKSWPLQSDNDPTMWYG